MFFGVQVWWSCGCKGAQASRCVTEVEKWSGKGGNLGQAGWGLSEEAEKAWTDLQQQRGSARQDHTVQGLNQGFGLGGERVRVCVGGGEEEEGESRGPSFEERLSAR